MDMLCIDITDQDDIDIGAEVELWGENINANDIAERCNTISYELFCQLTPRVKRIYFSSNVAKVSLRTDSSKSALSINDSP